MNGIAFGELPPRSAAYTKHAPIAAELREHPGQWARIARYAQASTAQQVAYKIRHAHLKSYAPAGAYEAEWRREGAGGAVWARYAGGGDA